MGLLLTAAPSGAERPTDPRSGCGNDLRPSSDGCPSQAGEALDGDDGDDKPKWGGLQRARGGARAGPHADFVVLAARETNPPVEVTAGLASFAGWCSSVARLRLVVAGLRPKA